MLTIVLAAGNGQRFADAGYPMPKPLLTMPDGRVLLAWVRERLPRSRQMIVARRSDQALLAPHAAGMRAIWIGTITNGPLASAAHALDHVSLGDELLVTYCDTLLPDGAQAFIDAARHARAATAMVVFPSDDPRYGYWDGQCVVEKQPVSPWAVSGLFYFRQGAIFTRRARLPRAPGAGLPSLMDPQAYCHAADVIDVGTPADYEALLHAYAEPV